MHSSEGPVELARVLKLRNQHERVPSRVDSEASERLRAQQDEEGLPSRGSHANPFFEVITLITLITLIK